MPTDANCKVLLAINVQHIAINSASTESINDDSPKLLNRYNGRSVGAIDATSCTVHDNPWTSLRTPGAPTSRVTRRKPSHGI